MDRLRSYYDADNVEKLSPTKYLTAENHNELFCGMCGDRLYVNKLILDDVHKVMEITSDNPFLCEDCLTEYEEMARG